jgi:tRNA (cmo5U34)-methyltransferase
MPDQSFEIPRNWTFERADVAAGFDRHVREQLPWYEMATNAISHIARHYIPERGLVYDIGASTGNVGNALDLTLRDRHAEFIALESSAHMAEQYRGPGQILNVDASKFIYEPFDLAVAFLVLMFMPPEDRVRLIAELRRKVKPGGAIVVFDKTEAVSGYPATVFARLTLAGKVAAGVEPNEIVAKELSLGGVQRPINPQILGHDAIEWFRFGEFAGWLIQGPSEGMQQQCFQALDTEKR